MMDIMSNDSRFCCYRSIEKQKRNLKNVKSSPLKKKKNKLKKLRIKKNRLMNKRNLRLRMKMKFLN